MGLICGLDSVVIKNLVGGEGKVGIDGAMERGGEKGLIWEVVVFSFDAIL